MPNDPHPDRATLRELLVALFDPKSLRRFVGDHYPAIEADLSESATERGLAGDVARLLEQRGRVDAALRRALLRERGGRSADIDGAWGGEGAGAAEPSLASRDQLLGQLHDAYSFFEKLAITEEYHGLRLRDAADDEAEARLRALWSGFRRVKQRAANALLPLLVRHQGEMRENARFPDAATALLSELRREADALSANETEPIVETTRRAATDAVRGRYPTDSWWYPT